MSVFSTGTTSTIYDGSSNYITNSAAITAGAAYVQFTSGGGSTSTGTDFSDVQIVTRVATPKEVFENKKVTIDFPTTLSFKDGTVIDVKGNGNFVVNDKDSKVIYKGNNIREFNRYINSSDVLEEFIVFLGKDYRVRQDQILQIPIELFINWLIMRASQEDGDSYTQEMKSLDSGIKKNRYINRCKWCGRFISKKLSEAGINFCNPEHYQLRLNSLRT